MLDVANDNEQVPSSKSSVQMVEECRCPAEYYGTSCQRCSKGFTKSKGSTLLGRCELCQCYGHTQDCDEETGQCLVSLANYVEIGYLTIFTISVIWPTLADH